MSTTTVTQLIFEQKQKQKQRISQIMRNCGLKQCRHAFHRRDGLDESYCFLGALYHEFGGSNFDSNQKAFNFYDSIGITSEIRTDIIGRNDIGRWSFTQIADYIEDKYNL